MNNSCIKAFYDEDNVIIIISNKKSSFYINGAFLPALLIDDQNYFTYKASYHINYDEKYIISNDFNDSCDLQYRYCIKTKEFDDVFYYDKDDLGPTYSKEKTTFKLWAPVSSSVKLCYTYDGKYEEVEMVRIEKGIYTTTIYKDLKNCLYTYKVTNYNVTQEVIDPYAYSCNANGQKSAVIDLNDLTFNNYNLSETKSINQAIIYELSVRDFSSDDTIFKKDAGKYKAFLKHGLKSENNNPLGIDYIIDLGISHVQLMPILDFATTDENNPKNSYNWGYDPFTYNCLEGSFSTDPDNPLIRLIEAKEMIDEFHKYDIKVTLDVVYNHTYHFINSVYNKIVPNYFYLMDKNGVLSNGSFCGNDIDTLRKMSHKYFVDMSVRHTKILQIDGFRFDLMGIITSDLILDIYNKCKAINPNFICYGEGWNMPSMLIENKRASLFNANFLPNIAFFNDFFRDTLSGKANNYEKIKGYLSGNLQLVFDFVKAMRGSVESQYRFNSALSSINYVECHDNYTLYDKLKITNSSNSEEERNKIQLCMLASIIFAEGTPFIHMGEEFNRSKFMVENSYNSDDEINKIRWELIDKYEKNIKAVKDFIKIRKTHNCFNLVSKKEILNSIDAQLIDEKTLIMTYASKKELVLLAFNPTDKSYSFKLDSEYKILANQYGIVDDDKLNDKFKIKPYSFMMLTK